MSRNWFLWLLPCIPLGAQTFVGHGYGTWCTTSLPKPKNGQCPVCATVAPKFEPTTREWQQLYPSGPFRGNGKMSFGMIAYWEQSDLPKQTEVTCAHCRVRFVQDAEIVKETK